METVITCAGPGRGDTRAGGNASAGTIDTNGLYTAPAVVPTPNNPVMVSAVSQADVTKSGAATVTLKAPTPAGTYTVTIAATAGSVVSTTTAVLAWNPTLAHRTR